MSGEEETRFIRELIYGKRGIIRYFQLTTDPLTLPSDSTYLLMTNLTGNLRHTLGNHYGLRTWIEYGFKQIKNELGWADYRLTDYAAIERWWELVLSAYLLVSLQTDVFQNLASPLPALALTPVNQHPWWAAASNWKVTLNNLRLVIQPFVSLALLLPWHFVFPIDALELALRQLIHTINFVT